MLSRVRVICLSEIIEGEIEVEVGRQMLTCFVSVCRGAIIPGQSYLATLSLWATDGLDLSETSAEPIGISRIGNSFRHRVVGVLRGAVLNAGIEFEDRIQIAFE